jgi:ribosomal protein S10
MSFISSVLSIDIEKVIVIQQVKTFPTFNRNIFKRFITHICCISKTVNKLFPVDASNDLDVSALNSMRNLVLVA